MSGPMLRPTHQTILESHVTRPLMSMTWRRVMKDADRLVAVPQGKRVSRRDARRSERQRAS
jgi:hypothetical protein